ncbi:MAG: GntR family transcriptional regulator [Rhodothermales bacterium]
MGLKRIDHKDLGHLTYHQVKELIVRKALRPGDHIRQDEMAQQLGVSRTPLLKALNLLERDLLVEFIPRRGYFVKQYTYAEMREVFQVREVLEGLAARLAAAHITPDEIAYLRALFAPFEAAESIDAEAYESADQAFHRQIAAIGANAVLAKLEVMRNVQVLAYQMGLHLDPQQTLAHHDAIIDALEDHNGAEAERLMRAHIHAGTQIIEQHIAEGQA